MGITDELRKWKGNIQTCLAPEVVLQLRCELNDIADRIDMEHQKAIRELNNLADASVLLPVDADGVPIHIGDVMEWCDSGETLTVEGIGSDVLFYIDGEDAEWTAARNKRHHHKPTVEDVLCELLNEYREGGCALEETRLSDYADKLRMVDENE